MQMRHPDQKFGECVIGVSGGAYPRNYGGEDTQFDMAASVKPQRLPPCSSVWFLRRFKGALRRADARA